MTLSRKPLKGMRQLTPGEKRVESYIVDRIERAGASYGFEDYEAPVLEPLELFLAKSGSELAVDQSYNFTDKGGRDLIMRPELTPSLARMVAASGELISPVRWMSFPVCYRYENTQRGRAREFLQFNLDVLGIDGLEAELDVFLVLRRIMRSLGASSGQYVIRYSSRRLASAVLEGLGFEDGDKAFAYSLIDKKDRMPRNEWEEWVGNEVAVTAKAEGIARFANCHDLSSEWLKEVSGECPALAELVRFEEMLKEAEVAEARFEASVVRGLDYYTGLVFELMDTGGKNRRSICGGGRYDDLVGLFGGRRISGVGFGLGLLTLQLFLETYGLIPEAVHAAHPADLFLAVLSEEERPFAVRLAESLRDHDINVEMAISGKNLSRQLGTAQKKSIGLVCVVGPEEIESGEVSVRDMSSGEESRCSLRALAETVRGLRKGESRD